MKTNATLCCFRHEISFGKEEKKHNGDAAKKVWRKMKKEIGNGRKERERPPACEF